MPGKYSEEALRKAYDELGSEKESRMRHARDFLLLTLFPRIAEEKALDVPDLKQAYEDYRADHPTADFELIHAFALVVDMVEENERLVDEAPVNLPMYAIESELAHYLFEKLAQEEW